MGSTEPKIHTISFILLMELPYNFYERAYGQKAEVDKWDGQRKGREEEDTNKTKIKTGTQSSQW